jgi:hypothetical protein
MESDDKCTSVEFWEMATTNLIAPPPPAAFRAELWAAVERGVLPAISELFPHIPNFWYTHPFSYISLLTIQPGLHLQLTKKNTRYVS